MSPSASRCSSSVRSRPLLAAGEERERDPGGVGERRDRVGRAGAPSSSVGAISAACAPALDHGRRRQQRDHRLARADVALQQPEHALGPGEVGDDLVDCPPLRGVSAKGSAWINRARSCPAPAVARPAGRRRCARTSASASWPASNSS